MPLDPRFDLVMTTCLALGGDEPVFDMPRRVYPDFTAWYAKCRTEHRRLWVARAGDAVAGIAIAKHEGVRLKLCTLAVDQPFTHQGLSRALLETVESFAEAKQMNSVYFSANVHVVDVHRFAERNGYALIHEAGAELYYEKTLGCVF